MKRILIAEDDDQLCKVVVRQLKRLGFEPVVVSNGSDAVTHIIENGFKMILMDIAMPGMDGLEATRRIREFEQAEGKQRVPIVAMTGQATKKECITAGMDDFLEKPVLFETLSRAISRHVA